MEPKQQRSGSEYAILPMEVGKLLLDPENPRLASGTQLDKPTQFELLKILWTEMAVDELVLSIAANGYFPEEPLFVIPAGGSEQEQYYVLEGNRRLAAVKILLDNSLRRKLRITDMPTLTSEQKSALQTLPISIYANRIDLWAFLSFRHINSPQEWDAYSKAKFVALVHEDYEIPLEEIATRIGDQHETVKRLYRGFKVLRQAEQAGVYDISEGCRSKFYFSHWYTALAYPQYQQFLGMTSEDFEKDNPVPDTHLGNLGELLTWIYGRKSNGSDIKPLVSRQNPDLNDLREVISNPSALDALRSGYTLERAHQVGIGDERRFREALTRAKDELQRAKGTVTTGYKGGEVLYTLATEIWHITRTLKVEMDNIRESVG